MEPISIASHRLPRPATRRAASAAIWFTLLVGAANAAPQERDFAKHADSTNALMVMGDRDREAIHPGNPLEIVGLGAEDNDFLASMPSLSRGEFKPVKVDQDEAYARAVAMLEDREHVDTPYTTRGGGWQADGQSAQAVDDAEEPKEEEPAPRPRSTAWIGMTLAAIASVVYCKTQMLQS